MHAFLFQFNRLIFSKNSQYYTQIMFLFQNKIRFVQSHLQKNFVLIYKSVIQLQTKMEAEPDKIQQKVNVKQLLRNIDCKKPLNYLISCEQKKILNYPQICVSNNIDEKDFVDENGKARFLSVDCEMVKTEEGSQLCNVTIINDQQQLVFQEWYKPKKVIDYLPHVTNLSEKKLSKLSNQKSYTDLEKNKIREIIKGSIIIGHDLANDMRALQIEHNAFIDTVSLLPHRFGIPFKHKLSDLAIELLQMPIQWVHHDPQEDAIAALRIVKQHIDNGRGTIEVVPADPNKKYQSIWEIIKDVQLDPERLLGLFLRGSRALGISIENQDHKSDWDYVVVYDTEATLNGRLITVPQCDISFFDKNSFDKILTDNDISLIEVFYLPQDCQIINKLKMPIIDLIKMRESLGFHLNKARMKAKRYYNQQGNKYKWKTLKAIHMQIRFMDNFLQFKDFGKIVNIKRTNQVWEDIKTLFEQKGIDKFAQVYQYANDLVTQKQQIVRKQFKMSKRVRKHKDLYEERAREQLQRRLVRDHRKQEHNRHTLASEVSRIKIFENLMVVHSSQPYKRVQQNPAHSKLEVVKQLRQNGLQNMDKFHISYASHSTYQNLIQLHYLQSAKFTQLAKECRGIIVDQARNYQIVALPYFKFFDYNDKKYSEIQKINIQKMNVYEKKDGSIAVLYFYKCQWQVASSSRPDGKGNYCFARKETTTEFAKEFWRIFEQKKYEYPDQKGRNKTFIFEMMSKNHIIVTQRKEDLLVLHGVRDIITLQQEDPIISAKKYGWESVIPLNDTLQFKTIADLVKIAESYDPREKEGFVLCDDKYTRIKVKGSGYVRMNWLGQLNLTANKNPKKYILCEIVLAGEADTFCEYCPEWKKLINDFQQRIKELNDRVWKVYSEVKKKGMNQSQFGTYISKQHKHISAFVFALRNEQDKYKGQVQTVMSPVKFYKFLVEYSKIQGLQKQQQRQQE